MYLRIVGQGRKNRNRAGSTLFLSCASSMGDGGRGGELRLAISGRE